jgi:hypothetical protein
VCYIKERGGGGNKKMKWNIRLLLIPIEVKVCVLGVSSRLIFTRRRRNTERNPESSDGDWHGRDIDGNGQVPCTQLNTMRPTVLGREWRTPVEWQTGRKKIKKEKVNQHLGMNRFPPSNMSRWYININRSEKLATMSYYNIT